ncbi:hypothetical protein CMI47_22145 [Candidatus Pacearchaeota archaeon]|nr:hypothetical protein [Candidatus Pacearchaeota archaeon]|tara:strand:- start:27364 stop:27924 length:561 start_codon:yes stop_codon:yes gene_type:complete
MRRLGSEAEIERRRKRNVLAVSLVMLFLLVMSSVGFAFLSGPGQDGTNADAVGNADGIYNVGNKWALDVGENQRVYFLNSPEEVLDIETESYFTLQDYHGQDVYIVSENSEATQEIAGVLGLYVTRMQEACYGTCEADLPEKTCDDNLIIFNEAEEDMIYQEDNCVFIDGDLKAVDAFLYKILGVI